MLSVELDYQLNLHVQTGEKGKKWVAFSYGPMILAQEINQDTQLEEPFSDTPISEVKPEQILEMLSKTEQEHSEIAFNIDGTQIKLIPYYMAGSGKSGPRTYFQCSY